MVAGDTIITISDVLEYTFCPRFIYFMHCLDIPQHEESRFKVLKGREIHEEKRITNPEYLRKKLGVIRKELNVFIASKKNHIKGIVDEVLFLDDETAAPFEYKFAEFKNKIFKTHKFQLVLHAIMIKENYNIDVNRGFICYTRSNNHIEEVGFTENDFNKGIEIVNEILEIIVSKSVCRIRYCCSRSLQLSQRSLPFTGNRLSTLSPHSSHIPREIL